MDKIRYLGKRLVVLPVASILTACIHIDHHPFPDRWEILPSIAENVCTDVAGTFGVTGESDAGKHPMPLAYVFLGMPDRKKWPPSKFDKSSFVTIEQAPDVIRVFVWANTTMIAQKELKKDEKTGYLCTTEGIEIRGQYPHVHGLAGYIGQTHTLFKAIDGALIVKSEASGGGLALVIPSYSSETFWYRYRPYHKSNKLISSST